MTTTIICVEKEKLKLIDKKKGTKYQARCVAINKLVTAIVYIYNMYAIDKITIVGRHKMAEREREKHCDGVIDNRLIIMFT